MEQVKQMEEVEQQVEQMEKIVSIPVESIKVLDRYRKDMGDLTGLAESIKTVGQFVPIIVSEGYVLIAGERRLKAHKLINKPTINAVIRTKDAVLEKIIEITENLERKDFTWQEQVAATDDLHRLLKAQYGDKWSERKTAEKIGLANATVSTDLNLADALKISPELFARCQTKNHALKTLQKLNVELTMKEIVKRKSNIDYGSKAKNHIFKGDCTKLVANLPDKIVNAVISDPFYGVDISKTKKGDSDIHVGGHIEVYEDNLPLYKETMSSLISQLPRVMTSSSWLLMFCAIQNFYWLKEELEKHGFSCDVIPGIWHRTGNSGQSNNPPTLFGRQYEVFIYGYRGSASLIKQGQPNVLVYPGTTYKDHPVQKPLTLMEDLIRRFCLPGHIILDPFAGAGTTLVAGMKCGCNPIGFELDENYYNTCLNNVADCIKKKDAGKLNLVE